MWVLGRRQAWRAAKWFQSFLCRRRNRLVHSLFWFFNSRGGDRLAVFDCVSCSGREAAAGSGFLGPGFAEDVACAGFVADGDGVTACEG